MPGLLIVGDSLTAAHGLFPVWPNILLERLNKQRGALNVAGLPRLDGLEPIVVQAQGGRSYLSCLPIIPGLAVGAGIVLTMLGQNDCTGTAATNLAGLVARATAYLAAIRAANPACRLLVCDITPFGFTGAPEELTRTQWNALIPTRPAWMLGAEPVSIASSIADPSYPNLILTPGPVSRPGFGTNGGFAFDAGHPSFKGNVALGDRVLAQLLGLPDAWWGPLLAPGYSFD